MTVWLSWLVLVLIIMLFLLVLSVLISSMSETSFDTNESFECGFFTGSDIHLPFCVHFFVVGILFVVFDMELVVSLPLIMANLSELVWLLWWLVYSIILFIGILLEVMCGSIDWGMW
uniref:NADH-ubiquinone oxidoreductase chain 3 n=1 Tax=Haematopinus apri TaxID=1348091 RepID=R9ZQ25_9NEOP|nr:NADH dehydrogenase subunit 1 [Haematopinus apri]